MILMPQAAIDDSGSEPQSPIFILAGFIASAVNWAAFAIEWQAALDEKPGLDYFKMKEANRLQDQFDRKKGWDEAKRDDRLITFTRIIKKYAQVRIHASVRNDLYEEYIQSIPVPQRGLGIDSPYIMLFMQIILAAATFGDQLKIFDPCDFIFDEQKGFSEVVDDWWPNLKMLVGRSKRSDLANFVGSRPRFCNEKQFLPLQAADLYAWHLRQHYIQNRVLFVPPNRVLRQFEGMSGIVRNYDEPELMRLRDHLLKGGEIFSATNPGIPLVHIGKTKSERKRSRKKPKKAPSSKMRKLK